MTSLKLFREESVAERNTQWLGTVLLAPRVSGRVFAVVSALSAAAVLGLLFFGSYTRTERVGGWLVPHDGVVQVFAPQSGVVTRLMVHEGSEVAAGQPLLVLSAEVESAARGATQLEVSRLLLEQRESLGRELERRSMQQIQRRSTLLAQLRNARAELAQVDADIALQRKRVALATESQAREQELARQGFSTAETRQAADDRRLEQVARLGELQGKKIALQRDSLTLRADLDGLPLSSAADSATIERQIIALEQQIAEAESRREIVVPAPASGVVSTMQVERGMRPGASTPLLNIVPAGSVLEANLFATSRAIGFLRPGQRVRLRYQAFPYQKFGHYEGVLASVSGTAVNPGEMPAHLSGLTGIVGAGAPVYRVVVRLTRQAVTVYGRPTPLQPGMQLDADVVIERRRLVEWVLDPLFTLTGTWGA